MLSRVIFIQLYCVSVFHEIGKKKVLKNHDSSKDDLHFVKDLLWCKIKVNIIIESLKKRLLSEKK